jgi:hypothetical protein
VRLLRCILLARGGDCPTRCNGTRERLSFCGELDLRLVAPLEGCARNRAFTQWLDFIRSAKMQKRTRTMLGVCVGLAAALLVLTPTGKLVADTHGTDDDEQTLAELGLAIAPVPLTYSATDKDLVGLGSYLVNAAGDCNGCHTGGGPPNFNYAPGFNPYFSQPAKVDPRVYLSGGQDFGQVAIDANFNPIGPHIIARNLTPNKTGRAEGGNTFDQFRRIMRHGTDLDHLHPPCSTAPSNPNCLFALPGANPVDGNLLQIMPWPTFSHMTDHHLFAIYKYLSAIPCIEGPATPADLPPTAQYAFTALHNDCH